MPPYARVVAAAAKVPEPQLVPTVVDARFPAASVVLYPDTASLSPDSTGSAPANFTDLRRGGELGTREDDASALPGTDSKPGYLLLAENWYPDWHATVDGKPAQVLRADHTLLSVVLPSGAREVNLAFDSPTYRKGKMVSLLALLAALAMAGIPALTGRKPARA